MVEKALMGIHSPIFMDCFIKFDVDSGRRRPGKRFDAECLAVIAMVLRLVYRPDDRFEM